MVLTGLGPLSTNYSAYAQGGSGGGVGSGGGGAGGGGSGSAGSGSAASGAGSGSSGSGAGSSAGSSTASSSTTGSGTGSGGHGPSTGSTDFAGKDIFTKAMDYLWRKVVKAPPVTPAARGSHLAVRRVGKKAARTFAANKGDRKPTVLAGASPKAAAPGTEIQVMWWPDADVIVATPSVLSPK
jgi:hypothetical protein